MKLPNWEWEQFRGEDDGIGEEVLELPALAILYDGVSCFPLTTSSSAAMPAVVPCQLTGRN